MRKKLSVAFVSTMTIAMSLAAGLAYGVSPGIHQRCNAVDHELGRQIAELGTYIHYRAQIYRKEHPESAGIGSDYWW